MSDTLCFHASRGRRIQSLRVFRWVVSRKKGRKRTSRIKKSMKTKKTKIHQEAEVGEGIRWPGNRWPGNKATVGQATGGMKSWPGNRWHENPLLRSFG